MFFKPSTDRLVIITLLMTPESGFFPTMQLPKQHSNAFDFWSDASLWPFRKKKLAKSGFHAVIRLHSYPEI
jgi:hypothetical protein